MSEVSLINGHIDGAEKCVICGRDIPEGSQVCVICGKVGKGKQTNYDRIRNMSVEEFVQFLEDYRHYRCLNCIYHYEKGSCFDKLCVNGIKKYFESESKEE